MKKVERYHIGRKGKPARCKAEYRCPLASELLHFDSLADARSFQQRKLEEELPAFVALSKPGFQSMKQVRRGFNGDSQLQLTRTRELAAEKRRALLQVSEEDSSLIGWYQGTSYRFVNLFLRFGREGLKRYLTKEFSTGFFGEEGSQRLNEELDGYEVRAKDVVKHFDTLLEKAAFPRSEPRVLHRAVGVTEEELQELLERYKPGALVEEASYLSTTADSDAVLLHGSMRAKSEQTPVVFELLTKRGMVIHQEDRRSHISGFEREVLLPRGMKFKVEAVGEASYESTWPGGRPDFASLRDAPKRKRVTVIQLREVEEA